MVYTMPKLDFTGRPKRRLMYNPILIYRYIDKEYPSTSSMIGIDTPMEVALSLGKHCPFCGHRLKMDISLNDIKIEKWDKRPLRKKLLTTQPV